MKSAGSVHEDYSRHAPEGGSSDRGFGLVFAAFFAAVGFWPLLKHGGIRVWALAVAGLFLVVALAAPRILSPLNRVWTALGIAIGRVTNPVITAVIFFLIFTPVGFVMRMMGSDPLRRRLDQEATSYWIKRDPAGPPPADMVNQF